jgi:hypothetical protein
MPVDGSLGDARMILRGMLGCRWIRRLWMLRLGLVVIEKTGVRMLPGFYSNIEAVV